MENGDTMNLKRSSIFGAAMLAVFLASSAAASDSGLYIGAGVGQANLKASPQNPNGGGNLDFDATGTASKAFLGYRFAMIPLIDIAAEAAYNDFGKPSKTINGQNVQYKVTGASGAGLLIFPLGPIDLFGKAGVMSWSSSTNIGGTTSSKSGTNGLYGVGVGFRIWKIGVRAEYEYFQVKDIDRAQMVTVSGVFQF
jgi:hypothetical protein